MALHAAIWLVGCGRVHFDSRLDASAADAGVCRTWDQWSTPVPVPELNSPNNDYGATITHDELLFCLASGRPGGMGGLDIWCTERTSRSDAWPSPTIVGGVSSTDNETGVVLSSDGLEMFFASNRPGGAGGRDLYVASRASRTSLFGAPVRVVELSTAADDGTGALSADGLRFYMARNVPPNGSELFVASRPAIGQPFGAPDVLAELNSPQDDDALAIRSDELEVYFSTARPGGDGAHDIWTATRSARDVPFDPPVFIDRLSSSVDDLAGALTADGATLYLNYLIGSTSDTSIATRACAP
jgi:hypothetical protein